MVRPWSLGRVLVLAFAIAGCSAATQNASTAPVDVITAPDIQKANVTTAYDVVDRLARRWFRDLSGNASGSVAVYLSTDQKLGGKEALRDIAASDVVQLKYLKGADAAARYGASASGGAIIVTLR